MNKTVNYGAAIALFAELMPTKGDRHTARLAMSRVLCEGGMPQADAITFLQGVDPYTTDPQNDDSKIRAEVEEVYDHITHDHHLADWVNEGQTVPRVKLWGFTKLVKVTGDEQKLRKVLELLGIDRKKNPKAPQIWTPPGFITSKTGVFHMSAPQLPKHGPAESDEANEPEPIFICSPIEVYALTRNTESSDWGIMLRWKDRSGVDHQWAMPTSFLAGEGISIREELINNGVQISERRQPRELLIRFLNSALQSHPKIIRSVNHVGWYGDGVYVLPDRIVGSTTEELVLQSPMSVVGWGGAGTLDEWKENVSKLCIRNSRLLISVGMAFASVVAHPLNAEPGGLQLMGKTSTGKSACLEASASAWGDPQKGHFVYTWRLTDNGLETKAALHNDGLLILDELGEADPRQVGEVCYMLANGVGKLRMSRSGKARKPYTFSTMFLCSGEISLADHMKAAGQKIKGGQEIRCLNLPAVTKHGVFEELHGFPDGQSLHAKLTDATRQFYGTAIPAFLEKLLADRQAAMEILKSSIADFIKKYLPKNASGEVHRACQRFALIAAAGDLATRYGITGWNSDDCFNAACRCFKDWYRERGSVGAMDAQNGIRQVRLFLEKYGESRFEPLVPDPDNKKIVHQRAGFHHNREYFVLPETFKTELCAGYDYKLVAETLIVKGYMVRSKNRLTESKRIPALGTKPTWVYHITADLFSNGVPEGTDAPSIDDAFEPEFEYAVQ